MGLHETTTLSHTEQATVEVLRDDISEPGPCALVDRSGRHSLFACLQECCPSAIRNDNPFVGRHGMTEIEYSKVLEKNGFLKLRNRSLERAESRACAVEQRVNAPGRESVANINGGQGEGQGIKPLKGSVSAARCLSKLFAALRRRSLLVWVDVGLETRGPKVGT
jgi:hypothetical protein